MKLLCFLQTMLIRKAQRILTTKVSKTHLTQKICNFLCYATCYYMKKEKKLFGNASAKLGFTRRLTDAFLTSRFIPLIVFFESFQKHIWPSGYHQSLEKTMSWLSLLFLYNTNNKRIHSPSLKADYRCDVVSRSCLNTETMNTSAVFPTKTPMVGEF